MYNDILDSTRSEYERAMYGRRTTEDLDIVEATPEQNEVGQAGSVDTQNQLDQAEQEIDDDIDR
jgi:hypothetical protein